jgi:hypothetical protein
VIVVVAASLLTIWVRPADVLGANKADPVNAAVIARVPAEVCAVANVAVPASLIRAVPSRLPLSKNCTSPVGLPAPLVTLAV